MRFLRDQTESEGLWSGDFGPRCLVKWAADPESSRSRHILDLLLAFRLSWILNETQSVSYGMAWIFMQTWNESSHMLSAVLKRLCELYCPHRKLLGVSAANKHGYTSACLYDFECRSLCCDVMQENICVLCLKDQYLIRMELTGVASFFFFFFFSADPSQYHVISLRCL